MCRRMMLIWVFFSTEICGPFPKYRSYSDKDPGRGHAGLELLLGTRRAALLISCSAR